MSLLMNEVVVTKSPSEQDEFDFGRKSVSKSFYVFAFCFLSIIGLVVWPKYLVIPYVKVNFYTIAQFIFILLYVCDFITKGFVAFSMPGLLFFVIIAGESISFLYFGVDGSIDAYVKTVFLVQFLYFNGLYIGSNAWRLELFLKLILYLFVSLFFVASLEHIFEYRVVNLFLPFLDLNDNFVLQNLLLDKLRDGDFRVSATLDHPIILAIMCGAVMPLLISNFLLPLKKIEKMYALFFMVICLYASYSTHSRTALVALPASVFLFTFIVVAKQFVSGRFVWFLVASMLFMLFFSIFFDSFFSLLEGRSSLEFQSSQLRELMWQKGTPFIEENPFWGWGIGSDIKYAGLKQGSVYTIDDSYLSMLINNGYFGFSTFFTFIILVFSYGVHLILKVSDTKLVLLLSSLIAAMVCILLSQKANSISYPFCYVYLFSGIIVSVKQRYRAGVIPPKIKAVYE